MSTNTPDQSFFDGIREDQEELNSDKTPRDINEAFGRPNTDPFVKERKQTERAARPDRTLEDAFGLDKSQR